MLSDVDIPKPSLSGRFTLGEMLIASVSIAQQGECLPALIVASSQRQLVVTSVTSRPGGGQWPSMAIISRKGNSVDSYFLDVVVSATGIF
jgi:hypothetical protein